MTSPRLEVRSGRTTAASDGPSFATPTSGLTTLPGLHFVIVLPDDPFLASRR